LTKRIEVCPPEEYEMYSYQARLATLRNRRTEGTILVIAETALSTWNYHLRLTTPDGVRRGGGVALEALCGKKVGWDTQVPLSGYGHKVEHIPETYCDRCRLLAQDLGFEVGRK
jgi:hypothetical protein